MSFAARFTPTFTPDTAFPPGPLNLQADLNLGGTWTAVGDMIYQRDSSTPVTITRGRADETSQAGASTAAFQFNNRAGQFSPKNPFGAYYGLIGKNTPIRFSLPEGGTYLRLEDNAYDGSVTKCATVSTSSLSITGDIDIRMDLEVTNWGRYVLAAKYTSSGNQRSWALVMNRDGTLGWWWTNDGTAGTLAKMTSALPLPPGRLSLRVTFQPSTGTVAFETGAPGNAGNTGGWTQLGSLFTVGPTTMFGGNAELGVARAGGVNNDDPTYYSMNGRVFEFELRSGLNGTVVADPVFSSQTAGAGSFIDAQSNIWIMSGAAELSDRKYRGHFEMAAYPQRWDNSGKDVWVDASAGGLLRRLGQGQQPPLDSALKRAILAKTGALAPEAYWPVEDGSGSDSIGSAIGGPSMTITGSPQLASDSAFACSNSIPQINSGQLTGNVPAYSSGGSIVIRFLYHTTSAAPDGTVICRALCTHSFREFTLRYRSSGGLALSGWAADGSNIFDTGAVAFAVDNQPLWVSMELQPVGSNTQYSITTLAPGASSGLTFSGTVGGQTIGNVTQVQIGPNRNSGTWALGHLMVQSTWESLFDDFNPLKAWKAETAGNRFARLCQEEGIASRVVGPPATSAMMGVQAPDTLANLLQECEEADRGLIFEPRQALALGYRTLASMVSQDPAVTLDYAQAHLGDGSSSLLPTDDDQYTRNDWTVNRSSGGSSWRVTLDDGSPMSVSQPPAGVGDYADSKTVNVLADSQLFDVGGWLLNLGTYDGPRYPQIPLNLARTELASLSAAIQDAGDGDYVVIQNPPGWLPPGNIKQLIFGSTEVMGGPYHTITWNAVPEGPYEVMVLDDTTLGHVDTDGSSLHSTGIGLTDSTFTVDSVGIVWTTNTDDFPFDIVMGGEAMTVVSITGASSPQTFNVLRTLGTRKVHAKGEAISLANPVRLAVA